LIPLIDLRAQIEPLRDALDAAIRSVVDRAEFTLGPDVERFEQDFARYLGVAHCIGVQSGTAALEIALRAAGVGLGDEVVTTPLSFFATAEAISLVGAHPVFADVDPETLTLDPVRLEAAITARCKAIVPVHLYGQAAAMAPILAVAAERGVCVIEDACQAHGAIYGERRVGSLGLAGCFSFYPSKNLSAFGEGGAVTTNDGALAARARAVRDHGQSVKGRHTTLGLNGRLEAIQAAVLGVKLPHLDDWNAVRRALAARYRERLAGLDNLRPVGERSDGRHVYHLFVVRSSRRDRIAERCAARGIACARHYALPIHLQEAYRHLRLAPGSFPVAEAAAREVLSLPLYPELTHAQQDRVIDAVAEACA
jgi:dTDP-4-amino-4,6-dideoxygalactose transaminase